MCSWFCACSVASNNYMYILYNSQIQDGWYDNWFTRRLVYEMTDLQECRPCQVCQVHHVSRGHPVWGGSETTNHCAQVTWYFRVGVAYLSSRSTWFSPQSRLSDLTLRMNQHNLWTVDTFRIFSLAILHCEIESCKFMPVTCGSMRHHAITINYNKKITQCVQQAFLEKLSPWKFQGMWYTYCVAGNFRGRKLSWMSRFRGYMRKFSPQN